MERKIAKVDETFLGVEDHGHLTFSLKMNFGGTSQCIGMYSIDRYDPEKKSRIGTAEGAELIRRILLAFGVKSWEELTGRTVYVLFDERRFPVGIEPLPTERGQKLIFSDVMKS